MEKILTLRNLSAAYDGNQVLHNINMDIAPRQITAVIGPSGCGKSTLLACINRTLEEMPGATVSGDICLNGQDIRRTDKEELRRRIGLVFQTPAPFPFSIYKNMTYALRYYGIHKKEELARLVKEKLEMAGLYDEVKDELNKNAEKLSGGQQQRLCIARALTVDPDILLLDEPCSALDVKSTAAIEKMLLDLKKEFTIVTVTHNLAQARRLADQIAFIYNGRLIEYAPRDDFFDHPQQAETKAFLEGIYG